MEKNILAIDLGKGSIGLAISRSGMFVSPLPEVRFKLGNITRLLKRLKTFFLLKKWKILLLVILFFLLVMNVR